MMADAAMGIAFGTLLDADQRFTTVNIQINFIKSVSSGNLVAEGEVIHQGKNIGYSESKIYYIKGTEKKLIAKASSSLIKL